MLRQILSVMAERESNNFADKDIINFQHSRIFIVSPNTGVYCIVKEI